MVNFQHSSHILASPSLLSLPDVALRRGLEFLLLAHEVEITGPSRATIYTKSPLEVAILRTCRALHLEGQSVLRSNHFILGSSKLPGFVERCKLSNIRIWSKNLKNFKHFDLRLHVASSELPALQRADFFILCPGDINKFVDLLRFRTCLGLPEFRLKFVLNPRPSGAMLPLKIQRALLLPFTKIRGSDQKCTVSGCVDRSLADHVQDKMMPSVLWRRAHIREYIDLLKKKKAFADDVFELALLDAARLSEDNNSTYDPLARAHHDYNTVLVSTMANVPMLDYILAADDPTLADYFTDFLHRLNLNLLHVKLLVANNKEDPSRVLQNHDMNMIHRLPDKDNARKSLYEQMVGVADLCMRSYATAIQSFESALEKEPYAMLPKVGLEIAQRWSVSTSHVKTPEDIKRITTKLINMLPKKPLKEYLDTEPVSVIASLDSDLYLLQKLGYDGDLLEGRILQKQSYSTSEEGEVVDRPFDKAISDHFLVPILEERAQCNSRGESLPCTMVDVGGHQFLPNPDSVDYVDDDDDGHAPFPFPFPPPPPGVDIEHHGFMFLSGPGGSLVPIPGQEIPEGLANMLQGMGLPPMPPHHHQHHDHHHHDH